MPPNALCSANNAVNSGVTVLYWCHITSIKSVNGYWASLSHSLSQSLRLFNSWRYQQVDYCHMTAASGRASKRSIQSHRALAAQGAACMNLSAPLSCWLAVCGRFRQSRQQLRKFLEHGTSDLTSSVHASCCQITANVAMYMSTP